MKRRWLTGALLLGTWIPLAFFISTAPFGAPPEGLHITRATLIFLGLVHVPMTLILYVDRSFLGLVRENKARYVYLPVALIIGSGMIFTLGGRLLQACTTLLFLGWQAHHYGRQNVGVYAFTSLAHGWRPRPAERRTLELAAACGVCGTFKVLGQGAAPGALLGVFDLLFRAGFLAFIGVVGFGVYLFLKHRRDFSLGRAAWFFTLLLFFSPLFISSGLDGAFHSYATAHGIQYIILMAALSMHLGATEGRRGVSSGMVALATFMVLFGLLGDRAADLKAMAWVNAHLLLVGTIDFAAGISVGVTIAHFVVDAGAWKLSRPAARTYMTKRFGFLLAPSSS